MTLTEAELVEFGMVIGAAVGTPVFFALRGDLGAGKSVFARAVARGAGVTADMPSPTFNLVFRYEGTRGVDVVHLDLYRLDDPEDVWELGWRELGDDCEIVLVEWPEQAGSLLPENRWDVRLTVAGPELRELTLTAHGAPPPLPPASVTAQR